MSSRHWLRTPSPQCLCPCLVPPLPPGLSPCSFFRPWGTRGLMEAVESGPHLLGVLFTPGGSLTFIFCVSYSVPTSPRSALLPSRPLCFYRCIEVRPPCKHQPWFKLTEPAAPAAWRTRAGTQWHLTVDCVSSQKIILKDVLLRCGRTLKSSQSQGKYSSICTASLEICLMCNESCFILVAGRWWQDNVSCVCRQSWHQGHDKMPQSW